MAFVCSLTNLSFPLLRDKCAFQVVYASLPLLIFHPTLAAPTDFRGLRIIQHHLHRIRSPFFPANSTLTVIKTYSQNNASSLLRDTTFEEFQETNSQEPHSDLLSSTKLVPKQFPCISREADYGIVLFINTFILIVVL